MLQGHRSVLVVLTALVIGALPAGAASAQAGRSSSASSATSSAHQRAVAKKRAAARKRALFGYFLAIAQLVGEGHDRYVDDVFSSHDGRFIYISRPSLADVVAIELATRKILWRVPVEGNRADHMGISPDGTRLLVSASTARKVHVIDTAAGKIVANIESGDQPHESNFSADGKLIFHASIGTVYTPADDYAFDAAKGDRWL